jgi:2-hydroxychromene-2-carboxylate isomerase
LPTRYAADISQSVDQANKMPKHAQWFFDFVSPFSYLQFKALDRLPDSLKLTLTPVLFAGLLAHWGQKGPAEISPKRVDTYRYCHWYARNSGTPFQMPPAHPFNPLPFLRLAVALDCDPAIVKAIFEYIWAKGKPVHTAEGFLDLASSLGIDDPELLISNTGAKNILRRNTDNAIAAGIYGVPTILINAERFWGLDQTQMMLDYLENPQLIEAPEIKRLTDLPQGAVRQPPATNQ